MFVEAVFWCALVRMIMLVMPFRKYASLLGKPQKNGTPHPFGAPLSRGDNRELLEQIGKSVQRASANVPWKTRCFVEAIAAKRMLKRRNIKSTVYLGITKSNQEGQHPPLSAHAWIACGDFIVTGKQGVRLKEYTVVSSFV